MAGQYDLVHVTSAEDWEALHELRRAELFHWREGVAYDADHPADRAPNHFPLLLKLDGKPIGTARLDLLDGEMAASRLMAIDGSHQRQGHGRALARKFEEIALTVGVAKLVVNANPKAVGFYERLDFVHEDWPDPSPASARMAKNSVQMTKGIDGDEPRHGRSMP